MKFFRAPISWITLGISMAISCTIGAIRWICGRDQRITAEQYAKEHKIKPLAVISAAVEGRLDPPAFWERGPELPETFQDTAQSMLVLRSAVIHPPHPRP